MEGRIITVKYHLSQGVFLRTDAKFSDCRKYRYALWRVWDENKPYAAIIGLNPSTADEVQNDPTINRCISFARSWGYGGICMINLFAFRATVPAVMMSAQDPVGPDNDKYLVEIAKTAGIVVAAWGNDGSYLGRSTSVKNMIPNLSALKINKSGEPAHPLYLKSSLVLITLRTTRRYLTSYGVILTRLKKKVDSSTTTSEIHRSKTISLISDQTTLTHS